MEGVLPVFTFKSFIVSGLCLGLIPF